MLGKTYTAIILALTLVAGAAAMTAASTAITQIDLSRDGSFTVLTIHGNGQFRYAHESVEAAEGKPFRVVIDCLAARHNLPQFHFTELPPSIVTAIRTSQYSVTPEEVVRIVLDLAQQSVYRVEAAGDNVKVYVSDQKTAPFAVWTSGKMTTPPPAEAEQVAVKPASDQPKPTVVAAKPAVDTNAPVKKPIVVAKTEQTEQKNVTKATPAQVAKLPAPDNNGAKTPTVAKAAPKTTTPAPKQEVAAKPAATKAPVNKPVPAQALANDTIERAQAFAKIQPEAKAKPTTATEKPKNNDAKPEASHKSSQPSPAKQTTPSAKPTAQPEPAKPSPVVDNKETELADANAPADKEKVDLSRYRRASAKEAEIKSSKVVEFPKRMVIKYTKTNSRDPFESLIALADNQHKRMPDLNKPPNAEALHLVGVLESVIGKDAALLQDRDGIGFILRTGDRVQNGYVAQIRDDAVYFQINEYGWSRTVVKHMEKSN